MIKAERLTKDFGDVRAVDGVDFTANAGEVFGILGPNGAGKTTTLRMLATTLKPTAGTAAIAGVDILREPERVRSLMGVLTASIGLYDRLTARENIMYFGLLHGLRGLRLDKQTDNLIDLFGMRDYADRRTGRFSTGMKQKVALARAVVHDPPVLVFDEPTSGLDVIASLTITEFIRRSADAGKAVLLSTHNMTLAQKVCARACIIHEGAVVIEETVQQILESTKAPLLEDAFLALVGESAAKETA